MADGFEHQRINRIVSVFGNHPDMSCNDMCLKTSCKIHDTAEEFCALHVLPLRLERMPADVSADCGNRQPVHFTTRLDFLDLFIGTGKKFHIHADLDTLKTHLPVRIERFQQGQSQRTRKSSDLHTDTPC